jgi:Ulp1 family protease
LDTLSN